MVIAHDFDYARPASLDEALDLLDRDGARVLAGGTDVVPWLRDDLIEPELLVDIKAIPGLDGIERVGDRLTIGALATFSDLIGSTVAHDAAPVLAEMAHQVASGGVRNRATIVGNVCSAVPSLDAGPVLLVHDAEVHVVGGDGARTLPLGEWFVGPKQTRLAAGELVTAITLHLPAVAHAAVFLKLARYAGEDLAQANLAVLTTDELEHRLAFGAVAPRPFRAGGLEALLRGRVLDDDTIAAARADVASAISPITDVRASAEYRTHMCGVMLDRGLRAAASRLAGDGPAYPARLI